MEIVKLQDPVARAIAYVRPFIPAGGEIHMDVPARWAWDRLLVVVSDTGGRGERDVVLDDVRLTTTVFHPDSVAASESARNLHGLLRQWPYQESGVRFLRTLTRPTFDPDGATRTPGYTSTVELSFKAAQFDLTTI